MDTPNTVLRKLLFGEDGNLVPSAPAIGLHPYKTNQKRIHGTSYESFDRLCWQDKFSGQPRKVSPYKTMWESDADVVYFQNFNKAGSTNLWYRLNPSALKMMRSRNKRAWICFTNPAESYGYLIPLEEIDKRIESCGWDRDEIEVNIDVANARWREFDWRLNQFEFRV